MLQVTCSLSAICVFTVKGKAEVVETVQTIIKLSGEIAHLCTCNISLKRPTQIYKIFTLVCYDEKPIKQNDERFAECERCRRMVEGWFVCKKTREGLAPFCSSYQRWGSLLCLKGNMMSILF